MRQTSVYEQDFIVWSQQQAELLRAGCWNALDIENLLEELDNMGKSEKQALQSLLRNIISHLLKFQLSSALQARPGWVEEISEFRAQAETKLQDTPSLRRYMNDLFMKAWPQARKIVEKSFRIYGENIHIPSECPYTLEQVLDYDFLPENCIGNWRT
jgi:predicted DNA-binding ribbon-helix-helix protein